MSHHLPIVLAALAAVCPAQEAKTWPFALDEEAFAALHELKRGESPKLFGEDLEVGGAKAYLSVPKGGAKTAVLVIHEWWGLNDHIKHWADRLAADGYAALAIDLYGGTVATTQKEARAAMGAVDAERALATLRAAHEFLGADERVLAQKTASIGWCFGGGWSLRLAMAEPDLDAAVVYYGHLVDDPEKLAKITAPVLGVFGDQDRSIPPASVDAFAAAMRKARKTFALRRYDANHAFANPSSARYDQENATKAWAEVRTFLGRHLSLGEPGTAGEFGFTIPEGWTVEENSSTFRTVTFAAGDDSECYVVVLRGGAGGLGANIDRWRAELGQGPLGADKLGELPQIPMLGGDATLVKVTGNYRGMRGPEISDAVLLGAVYAREDDVVFVKMIGPASEMESQDAKFAAFCRSMRAK